MSKEITNSKVDRHLMLKRISAPKAADILAEKIRDLILTGKVQEGEMLPTERDLVQDSGLSRSSVREALRILGVEGLIVTRSGRTGGSTVKLPGSTSVARSIDLFVKTHGIRLPALLDCRLAVEPFLAGRAAINRTEQDLARIQELHKRFCNSTGDILAYKRLNLDWHLAITRASGNEVLIILVESIADAIFDAAGYHEVTTEKIRREAVKAHSAVMRAIEVKDEGSAYVAMERHLKAYLTVAQDTLFRG
jgi:GntR family transcriptional repressor for pyruvate dehydrogenase complex|tara:strand:+ start:260 stop:1009 length:750 start_codon:yes stop_codon:yes gene_type:complete